MMIMIKASEKDKDRVISYLYKAPRENGFFIGDLESFSLEEEFLDLWFSEVEGVILSALLRYRDGFLVSCREGAERESMAGIIREFSDCDRVSGSEADVDRLGECIPFREIIRLNLAVLTSESLADSPASVVPRKVTSGDADELFDFLLTVEEFQIREKDRRAFGENFRNGSRQGYVIREQGRIVSSAQISGENRVNGVIVGVATDPAFRNRGYARACVSRICRDMVDSGKEVTLFYNNPDAGKMYKQLGFRDCGRWARGNL